MPLTEKEMKEAGFLVKEQDQADAAGLSPEEERLAMKLMAEEEGQVPPVEAFREPVSDVASVEAVARMAGIESPSVGKALEVMSAPSRFAGRSLLEGAKTLPFVQSATEALQGQNPYEGTLGKARFAGDVGGAAALPLAGGRAVAKMAGITGLMEELGILPAMRKGSQAITESDKLIPMMGPLSPKKFTPEQIAKLPESLQVPAGVAQQIPGAIQSSAVDVLPYLLGGKLAAPPRAAATKAIPRVKEGAAVIETAERAGIPGKFKAQVAGEEMRKVTELDEAFRQSTSNPAIVGGREAKRGLGKEVEIRKRAASVAAGKQSGLANTVRSSVERWLRREGVAAKTSKKGKRTYTALNDADKLMVELHRKSVGITSVRALQKEIDALNKTIAKVKEGSSVPGGQTVAQAAASQKLPSLVSAAKQLEKIRDKIQPVKKGVTPEAAKKVYQEKLGDVKAVQREYATNMNFRKVMNAGMKRATEGARAADDLIIEPAGSANYWKNLSRTEKAKMFPDPKMRAALDVFLTQPGGFAGLVRGSGQLIKSGMWRVRGWVGLAGQAAPAPSARFYKPVPGRKGITRPETGRTTGPAAEAALLGATGAARSQTQGALERSLIRRTR